MVCPIFFTIYLYTDVRTKKCSFAFYVLHFIRLHGGYAQPYRGGVAFHLSDRKAVLLPLREMLGADKKFRILRGFRLFAYSHVFEVGSANSPEKALLLAALVQSGSAVACGFVCSRRKCRSFKSDVLLHEGSDVLKLSQRAILIFNLLLLFSAAVKLLLRKIIEGIKEYERNRKKQKSQ